MRDIKIKVNDEGFVSAYEKFIGNQYENNFTRLIFDVPYIYHADNYFQYVLFTLSNGTTIVRQMVDFKCIIDQDITNVSGLVLLQVIIKEIEGVESLDDGLIMASQPISAYITPAKFNKDDISDKNIDTNLKLYLDEFDALLAEIRRADERLASILDSNPSKYAEIIDARGGYTVLKNRLDAMLSSITKNYNNIEHNKSDIASNYTELLSKINSLASGSPLVASSTSKMTDTTRVYVNTSDGKWYYYNGTSWVSGGTYQATEIADNSITEEKLNDSLSSELFDENSKYYNTKVAGRIVELEDKLELINNIPKISVTIQRWQNIGDAGKTDTPDNNWFASDIYYLHKGDKIVYNGKLYTLQLVKFDINRIVTTVTQYSSSPITISEDGYYAITGFSTPVRAFTDSDIDIIENDILFSSFSSNRLNDYDDNVNKLNKFYKNIGYYNRYDSINAIIGRWLASNTIDTNYPAWCASERMFLRKGDTISYDGSRFRTQLITFSNAQSVPASTGETLNDGLYTIERDGYYALNIFKHLNSGADMTDEMVNIINETFIVNAHYIDNITDIISKNIEIDVTFYKGKVSTGNTSYFHTSNFSSKDDIIINFSNTEGNNLADVYPQLYVINSSNVITYITENTITLPSDTYYLEGYRTPITEATNEQLELISSEFKFYTIGRLYSYYDDGSTESSVNRIKPYTIGNERKVIEELHNEFKYPTIPVWGHEYLQHWYERVYEAKNNATVVLDGDSITAGYNPEYPEINDAFNNMRGYAIKKIMKAGNYPLNKLTVVNNGHGGRKTGEWVGNPTYGASNYIAQYPNGFLDVAMSNNPDLLIIAWGMNDADKTNSELSGLTLEERLNVFRDNMIEGLERIRGNVAINGRPAYNKPIEELSIIICLPIVGGSEATGRGNYLWNQYVREIIRPLCRKYGCAFADMTMRTYAHNDMTTKTWATRTTSGAYGNIHPNIWSSAQTMSMLQDLIYPVCMWNLDVEEG